MADIEELIERLEFLRCQPNSKRSNDAVDDALETAATALSAQQREIAELREAAEIGLEYVIEAANDPGKTNAMFDNIMRDLKRIETALNTPSQEGEKR